MVRPGSPGLLRQNRKFSLPTSQGVGSNPVQAAITITLPAYSLFPFTDSFEDEDKWFTPRFPLLPVPPGFSHIGQPGSLSEPSPVRHASLSSSSVSPADSLVERIITVNSTPVDPVGQEPSSSVALSSADWVDAGVSSPGSVQSDGSLYSAANSPTDQAPVIYLSPDSGRPCCPFVPANPHPRIRDNTGNCAYQFTTYREADFAKHDVRFGLPLHHPQLLEWVGAPESARLLYRDSSDWIRSLSRSQAINAARQLQHDACLMTSNLNILYQYVLCLQGTASKVLELTVGHYDFPLSAMESAAPVPRVCRASVHMEAMGLTLGPKGPAMDFNRTIATTSAGPLACDP